MDYLPIRILHQKFNFSLILSIIFCTTNNGQVSFQKTFGGQFNDFGNSVQQTTDGGYILFGQTESFGKGFYDMYLVKTDYLGNKSWEKTFGTEKFDIGTSVQQTSDGGYILCGAHSGFGNDSLALIRTDDQGNVLWNHKYRGSLFRDVGRFVQQTMEGGFIAVGYNGDSFIEDVFLLKTDADGNEEWKKTYGGVGREYGICIRQTSDGGYVIVGQTGSKGNGGDDMYLLRTDSFGDTLWTKTFGTENYETGNSVYVTSDGGFILLGSESELDGDMYLVKTDADGNEVWSRYYGGARRETGYAVQQTTDHGFILAGSKEDEDTHQVEMYCIKTDSTGDVQWESVYPKGVIDDATSVQQTSDGGYILLGTTTAVIDSVYRTDMYLVKIDSTGLLSGLSNSSSSSEIVIKSFPNPFSDYAWVEFKNQDHKNFSLVLCDTQGKKIREYHNITAEKIRIERNDLVAGVYYIQLKYGNKILGTASLIVI